MTDKDILISDLNDISEILNNNGYGGWCEAIRKAVAILKEQEEKPLRCDKCCYHREDGWCTMHGQWVTETDYCSFGAWEGR